MRIKISNLNDLTDSREILESRPHPFVPLFISILVTLIIGALVWSYFGKLDVVAKANSAMQEENLKALESWTTGQCAEPTVTCSLISKGGKIAWEVVTY